MSTGELLLILLVTIIVFGPNKLSMLAGHLGQLFRYINRCKDEIAKIWQTEQLDYQLKKNQQKALEADRQYKISESSDDK